MSVFDAIGGGPAVQTVVDEFYARVLRDPDLAPVFTGTSVTRLKNHQRAFISAALGGPQQYGGRSMASAHAGLNVSNAQFDAVVGHLVDTLTGAGVPDAIIVQIGTTLGALRADIVADATELTAAAYAWIGRSFGEHSMGARQEE
jgi:hemoglobin